MAGETRLTPQTLMALEKDSAIEGKMTAVFTGDAVRLSLQGGPLDIPLGERSTRVVPSHIEPATHAAIEVRKGLGAAADNRQYDRFGRDQQDLMQQDTQVVLPGMNLDSGLYGATPPAAARNGRNHGRGEGGHVRKSGMGKGVTHVRAGLGTAGKRLNQSTLQARAD